MRREDWPERLALVVFHATAKKFKYGEHDCCLFAAECVKAITGVDHAAKFRGEYANERAADLILADLGGVAGIADAALGARIDPKTAQRGDVVLIEQAGRQALGVCVGIDAAYPGKSGLVFLSMAQAITAWRVA